MKRSISSNQRKVEILTFIVSADGATVTGLDKHQVSVTDTGTGVKTVELNEGMTSADYTVQVTTATAATIAQVSITDLDTFVVNTFAVDGTTATDAVCHITVIGSKISERV
jgi:hypothetical protein